VLISDLRGTGIAWSGAELAAEVDDVWNGSIEPEVLHDQWSRWIDMERQKRLAWSIFEYDCSLCTLTNRRAAFDLSELPHILPCSESLWAASDASTWHTLKRHTSTTALGASSRVVLRSVLAGQSPPNDLPPWSRRLCAQMIGRQLWDIKRSQSDSISTVLSTTALFEAQSETKAHLLNGLDLLAQSLSVPLNTLEMINSK
jgi:hypothetical protein